MDEKIDRVLFKNTKYSIKKGIQICWTPFNFEYIITYINFILSSCSTSRF